MCIRDRLLSFAAGAMLYVVVEELIPEANLRQLVLIVYGVDYQGI